jgi:hypothetical protein
MVCKKIFRKYCRNLNFFIFAVPQIKVVPLNLLKDPKLQEQPAIVCVICFKRFKRKYNLDRHVSEVHLTV